MLDVMRYWAGHQKEFLDSEALRYMLQTMLDIEVMKRSKDRVEHCLDDMQLRELMVTHGAVRLMDATVAATLAARWVTFIENLTAASGFEAFSFEALATALAVHVVPDEGANEGYRSMLKELMIALKHMQQERGPNRTCVNPQAAAQWEADEGRFDHMRASRMMHQREVKSGRSAVQPRPRVVQAGGQARSDSGQATARGKTASPPTQEEHDADLAARLQHADDEHHARQIQADGLAAARLASTPVERLAGQKLLKAAAAKEEAQRKQSRVQAHSPRTRGGKNARTTEGRWQAGHPDQPAPPPPPQFTEQGDDSLAIYDEQVEQYTQRYYPKHPAAANLPAKEQQELPAQTELPRPCPNTPLGGTAKTTVRRGGAGAAARGPGGRC